MDPAGSGRRSGSEYIPVPDGRYAPRPDVPLPESSRPELPLQELPRGELPLPESSRPESSRPESSRRELPQPELSQPELPQPSGPRTDGEPSSPVATPDRTTAGLGLSAEGRAELVPGENAAAGNSANPETGRDDDTATAPMPVVLPGVTSVPRPDPAEAPRGFFEPARSGSSSAKPVSVTGTVEPPPVDYAPSVAPRPVSPEASAKLDQLQDLYMTAEAIGDEALEKHFEQVSQRQRELIKEFFKGSDSGSLS